MIVTASITALALVCIVLIVECIDLRLQVARLDRALAAKRGDA